MFSMITTLNSPHQMEQQDGFNTFHLKICLYRKGDGAFGSVYGEVEDENGGVWKFYGNASFEWEGSWEISELEAEVAGYENGRRSAVS